jgi:hypothetical protein
MSFSVTDETPITSLVEPEARIFGSALAVQGQLLRDPID